SMSALERVSSRKSFREFVIGITAHTKAKEIAGLFTNTTSMFQGAESVTEAHISTITDSIIMLRYVELQGEMRRGITVLKMRGSWHDKAIREFTIDDQGMSIRAPYQGINGILSGTPTYAVEAEQRNLEEMFAPGPQTVE
ncbi:MAG: ATPase domain-containing protein, partial [Myxococcota bacterium]